MVPAYHKYLSRCQQMLRRGLPVADILYLTPEGAPHVFRPPPSATSGDPPDRRGYNFDGVSPAVLIKSATVENGRIAFPGGMTYRVLVLPYCKAMTPALLTKIKQLVIDGATVIGAPPQRSPSLADFPHCDDDVRRLAGEIWGTKAELRRDLGLGTVIRAADHSFEASPGDLYPDYASTARALMSMEVGPDFEADSPLRYTHRRDQEKEIYFVANTRNESVSTLCSVRVSGWQHAEWWDPVTAQRHAINPLDSEFRLRAKVATTFRLKFAPYQSEFLVLSRTATKQRRTPPSETRPALPLELAGPWEVSFDPAWGGPQEIVFEKLDDWTQRPEEGIRHYSGKAAYRKRFDLSVELLKHTPRDSRISLGIVHDMASVRLNGLDLGIVWCDPWEAEVPPGLLRAQGNELEIIVANRWPNRMIGDQALPPEKRRTKTNWNPFQKTSSLLPSGLIGPVQVMVPE